MSLQTHFADRGGVAAGIALALAVWLLAAAPAAAQAVGIAAIVNDEPISAWDIDQRVKFYQATGGGKGLRERAMKELVDELLMRQEAERVGVTVSDDAVIAQINARLRPLKRTYPEFKQFLRGRGVRIATLENRLRARLGWQQVIRRTYGNLVSITDSDIEEAVEDLEPAGSSGGPEKLVLQRIVLQIPQGSPGTALATRMSEAERIRSLFDDCASNRAIIRRFKNVDVTQIDDADVGDLQEPMRTLVSQAEVGQMTPPNPTDAGIEMFAVCSRSADSGRRQVAQQQLVTQELSMLSDRHLRDLRQDAVIDYR